jgi:hypothetical protein
VIAPLGWVVLSVALVDYLLAGKVAVDDDVPTGEVGLFKRAEAQHVVDAGKAV